MKHMMKYELFFLISLLVLTACNGTVGQSQSAPEVTETVNVQATVDVAIAATQTLEQQNQAAVEGAVSATLTALPPLPSPTAIMLENMSEEDMSAAVGSSVEEANDAVEDAQNVYYQSAEDNYISEDEMTEMYSSYYWAEDEINQALALAELYLELYYELGEESLALMTQVVTDLETLYSYADDTLALLLEIEELLAYGDIDFEEAIKQLEARNEEIKTLLEETQYFSENWMDTVHLDLEDREQLYLNIEPDNIPSNRLQALAEVRNYVSLVQASLVDGLISGEEMALIAQLGANASAGLGNLKAADLGGLSSQIESITRQVSRGELPQANAGIGDLQNAIPRR
ncbi:MAG: hypothetical protein JEZ06_05200 [Anaerolineaceae bacterium]|nr:hypothetical protein [Anaerolineaceae bacterium]